VPAARPTKVRTVASTVEDDRGTRGRWRPARIALLVAAVIVVGLVGYAGLHDTLQNSTASSALSDYLDDVQRGDYDRAYARLCSTALTDGYTEADHATFLKAQAGVLRLRPGQPDHHHDAGRHH